jgi:hypothetical protein
MTQNPYAGGGPQPGYEAWYEQPRDSSLSLMAVLSLIFSILCLTAPLGIIFGVASLFSIGASAGRKHGKGLAISGIVVGLVFCTCMSFVLVGGLTAMQAMQREFVNPVAATLTAVDTGDFKTARTGLAPGVNVTDEQLAAFAAAYQAETGKFKTGPQSGGELLSNYFKVSSAWQPFSQSQQAGGRNDLMPIVMEFEKGYAIVGLVVRHDNKLHNMVIFTTGGKAIWLIDPRSGSLPGTSPPTVPDPTPSSGETPPEPKGEGG